MEWMSEDYDILRRNCCHFSAELCKELGVGPLPSWLTSLAGAGAVLRASAHLAVQGIVAAPYFAAKSAIAGAHYVDETIFGQVNLSDLPDKSRPLARQLLELGFSKKAALEAAKR